MELATADNERRLICAMLKGGRLTATIDVGDFSYYADVYSIIADLRANRKTVDFASVSSRMTTLLPCYSAWRVMAWLRWLTITQISFTAELTEDAL